MSGITLVDPTSTVDRVIAAVYRTHIPWPCRWNTAKQDEERVRERREAGVAKYDFVDL